MAATQPCPAKLLREAAQFVAAMTSPGDWPSVRGAPSDKSQCKWVVVFGCALASECAYASARLNVCVCVCVCVCVLVFLPM